MTFFISLDVNQACMSHLPHQEARWIHRAHCDLPPSDHTQGHGTPEFPTTWPRAYLWGLVTFSLALVFCAHHCTQDSCLYRCMSRAGRGGLVSPLKLQDRAGGSFLRAAYNTTLWPRPGMCMRPGAAVMRYHRLVL